MAPDTVLTRDGPVGVPLDYVVPQGGELLPLTVRATIDGTAAASSYYAVVQVISPSGRVMGNYITKALAAGASADVTWFRGVEEGAASSGLLPIAETLMLPTWATSVTSANPLPSGVTCLVTVQGTCSHWNEVLNTGSPEADALFPSTPPGVTRVSTQVGLDPDTLFAAPSDHPHAPGHDTTFQINTGSGFAHVEPVGGPYSTPQSGHFYQYHLVGQGQAVSFRIQDSPLTDNYGAFEILISGVPAPGSSLEVTDGVTSVNGVSEIDFTSGATVTDGGGGLAQVAVTAGGSGITDLTSTGGTLTVTSPTGPTTNVDMPTTGVVAGTYGDATHTSRVTVDAEGRVTAASAVGISGLAGSGLVQLFSTTLGATAALDTGANGIAAGHGSLIVYVVCRSAVSAATEAATIRVNGDSGAHYDDTFAFTGAASAPSAGQTHLGTSWTDAMLVAGNTSTAGYATMLVIEIPFYDQTNWFKAGTIRTAGFGGSSTFRQALLAAQWESTAAINQLTIDTASHLLANSVMVVYGTQ